MALLLVISGCSRRSEPQSEAAPAASAAPIAPPQTATASNALAGSISKDATGADAAVARVELVLRVPARALEEVLSELRKTGTLLAENQSGHDVTDEYTDTEVGSSRLRRAFAESGSVALHVVTGIIVVLGALSPFVALGAAGLAVMSFLRRRRRAALQADHV